MALLGAIARHTGVRKLTELALGQFGLSIVQSRQISRDSWAGLPSRPIRTVLDVGALKGELAENILAKKFPNAIIHSFEPSPVTFPKLKQVADRSNGRILAHPFGLGAEEGQFEFNVNESRAASSMLATTDVLKKEFPNAISTEKHSVVLKRLDDVANILNIKDELLIKLDVQGFEDRVIVGGRETFKKAIACIIEVQNAPLYETQPTFHDLYSVLTDMGFRFFGIFEQHTDAAGNILYFDAVFMKADSKWHATNS